MRTPLCADIKFRLFANRVEVTTLQMRVNYLQTTLSDQVLLLFHNFLKLRAEHIHLSADQVATQGDV